jgi:hemolysin activation/secretion protein
VHGRLDFPYRRAGLALLALLPWLAALAQPPSLPPVNADTLGTDALGIEGLQQPRRERPALPEYTPTTPAPELTLPPVPAPEEGRLSSQLRVFVRDVRLVGNRVFSSEELGQVTAPYENRTITSEELLELRDKLTLYYVERGYINSGAVIPDQEATQGVITLRIIEGRLTRVEVSGTKRLRSAYVSKRILLRTESPLNLEPLRSQLLLLQQDPLIERLNAALVPGNRPGEALLRVKVAEARPYFVTLGVSNDNPPSSGGERAELALGHRNLSGWGDALTLAFGVTQGSNDLSAQYTLPLHARATALSLLYERTSASVIEEPFETLDLNIESETETYGIALVHPFYRTPGRQFSVGLSLQRRHTETTWLGGEFSPPTPPSTVTVLRFYQEWVDRRRDQVIAARSTFNLGIDALNATLDLEPDSPSATADSQADSQFLTWLGQFQWARRLAEAGHQVIFRTDLQLANDALLSLEKFALGGARSVRGYRENQLVRDNALVTSVELRVPLFRTQAGPRNLQAAVFADYGRAWNHEDSVREADDISSVGLGLRWDPHPKFHAELYWGIALRDIENPDYDLQDDGLHFALSYQLF